MSASRAACGSLRYDRVVVLGTFLKGAGLPILWPEFLAMAIIAAVAFGFEPRKIVTADVKRRACEIA